MGIPSFLSYRWELRDELVGIRLLLMSQEISVFWFLVILRRHNVAGSVVSVYRFGTVHGKFHGKYFLFEVDQ